MTIASVAAKSRQRYERLASISLLAFALALVIATLLIRISGGITAEGQLIERGENIIVQHPDGGQVSEVKVQDGDFVKAGTILIRLQRAELVTESERLERQRVEQDVRLARLRAAVDGRAAFTAPVLRGRETANPEVTEIVRTQSEALKAERAALAAELDRARRRQQGAEASRTALIGQIDANRARQTLIETEIADLSSLVEEQLISRTRLTALQREALEIRQRLEALRLEDTRLENEAAAARLDAASLARRDTDRLWQEIEDAELKRADFQRQIEAASARLGRLDITAPADGRVHELSVRNAGAFIDPGGVVLSLVPQSGRQRVRVRLSPADMDDVKMGQTARLRFDTFQRAGTPELVGEVAVIAPDRSRDPNTGIVYYTVLVDVGASEAETFARLAPGTGAPVSVLIETERRSLAAYMLAPARDAFRRMYEAN